MNCLVTGATGFLGTNLVSELIRQGWTVRASGMHGSDLRYLAPLGAEICLADITDAGEVDRLVRGCEVVFNVAGDTSFWNRLAARQRRVNVDGAVNVAEACLKHGVRRLVHTSTVDALGYNPAGLADEDWQTFNLVGMGYAYAESKREGEKRVLGLNERGLEVVVIYPGFMLGPCDYTLQAGRLFYDLRDRKLPACPPGGASFGHVVEVAKAHVAAATAGRPGEGYICAGVNTSFRELIRMMAEAIDVQPPRITAPRSLFVLYGYLAEALSAFTGKAPDMNPGQARYMSINAAYSSDRAVSELGYRVIPLPRQIEDALDWYRANDLWKD